MDITFIVIIKKEMVKINLDYEYIYKGLKKYKDDDLFLMEVPQAKEMIKILEDDETLFEERFFHPCSEEEYYLSVFIDLFEKRREDIKWYCENKKTTLKEMRRYECINNEEDFDREMDDILDIYNRCVREGYAQAWYYLYSEDWLFILTKEMGNDKKCPVKFALEVLGRWIRSDYHEYEKNAKKNRDIFSEINQTIENLKKYSQDEIFLKELPQVFHVIENLQEAIKSKDEDKAYDEFLNLSFIRDSIDLYKKNPRDMKFFYDNRDISRLIKVGKSGSSGYMNKLWNYVRIFEESKNFAHCWRSIAYTITVVRDEDSSGYITLEYNKDSIEEYMKWVISEINKR